MSEHKAHHHHIVELDGVRGIAVLLVLLLHFHAPFQSWRPLGPVSDVIARGFTGVDIFFVLSGFLITSILISTRGASNYFAAFYARRSLRIFPLAFVTIAAFYWLGLPLAHRHGQLLKLPESEQIFYWLFVGNWRQGLGYNDGGELGHFWSLAIEEQFYILFALLARFLRNRPLAWVSAALAVGSVAARIAVSHYGRAADPNVWRITFLHLDPIALGALLACSAELLAAAAKAAWALMALGIAGLFLPVGAGMAILAGGLLATGMVAMAANRQGSFFRSRALTQCGKYSYAMYVLQPAWLFPPLAKRHPHSWLLMMVALIGGPLVTFAMAWVSWNVLEKHFNARKRNFPYRYAPAELGTEQIVLGS